MPSSSSPLTAVPTGDEGYVAYHAPRYAFLLELLGRYGVSADTTLLDIGPSRLTALIRERFGCRVDTLGFGADGASVGGGRHFAFDLNDAQWPERWRQDLPGYEVVVMAEVLEHLYAAPTLVLGFVRTLLQERGILVLQTPNAASLPKRIKLLLGRNPFEMIRTDPTNPGHFREYTRRELAALAGERGFRVEECSLSFYFDARVVHGTGGETLGRRRLLGAAKNLLYRALPPPLREGITMVWRREGGPRS